MSEVKSIFGCYYPDKKEFNARVFFTENITALAELFGIEYYDLDLVFGYEAKSNVRLVMGTRKFPINLKGKIDITNHKLRVFYNLSVIENSLIKANEEGIEYLAGQAWCYIAEIFRTFVILEGKVKQKELLPSDMFVRFNIRQTYSKVVEQFVTPGCNWSPERLAREFDVTFISTYIAQMVAAWAVKDNEFDLEEVADIIRKTKRFNIKIAPL